MPRCQSTIAHQKAHSRAARDPNGTAAARPKAPQRRDCRTSAGRRALTIRARANASPKKRPQARAPKRSSRSLSSSSRDQRSPSVRFRSMAVSLYDMVVIGGGTAGLVASRTAAGLGARVVLIERDPRGPGGDCLWTGCVPSKALIAAGDLAHGMPNADAVGLPPAEPDIDFARVMNHVTGAQRTIQPDDSAESLERDGVHVIAGTARFAGPGRIEVSDGSVLQYRAALVATGSRPVIPEIDGLAAAHPLTNETVFDLRERPARLTIIGGGPIGS